ncbi:MAG: hypothetical protein QOF70_7580 [Acetobacteraceae bacterium]|nr:hypothetical protein [Acetobacteraceae bacterium]
MKIVPAVAVIPLLIILLTWLSLGAIDTGAERSDRALGEMEHFAMLEAALHRDVLSARTGVLRNYDPLVREMNALDASIERLRQVAAGDLATETEVDRLATSISRQEVLVEQFKSNNALLQNSLASFALISSRSGTPSGSGSAAPATSALVAAMLRLSLDTSAETAGEVRNRLDELAALPSQFGNPESGAALLAHGRLLYNLLPATDGILKELIPTPQRKGQQVLRAMILSQQSISRATAREFRTMLYLASLILVGLLAYLGWRLHGRAQALRRRAAFEHVIAGISMSFVTAEVQEIDSIVERALADVARCFGADRAYFVLSGPSPQTYAWSRAQIGFSAGWPDQAPLLVERSGSATNGVVHIPRVARLAPGEFQDALVAAGLQGWACACREAANGGGVLLGLDAVTPACRVIPVEDLGLLRMALDAVANGQGRKLLEEERARLEARLHQARRLETVGALASGIAHNFNNIIGAILGYTEMAVEMNVSDNRGYSVLNEIHRAGERARELVDQILTFSRRRDVHHSPVSIHTLVAEATSLLRASLRATIELSLGERLDSAVVSGVAGQLQQVIMNLCNNAAQAMDEVGCIELEVDAIDISTGRSLSHGLLPAGRYVRIAVSDAGRGIDDADVERLFEPFFTTRSTGNGLGLATTREIVNEHGGAIDVTSTVGNGSRFEVWLPRIVTAVSMWADNVPALPLGRGETVLVVEEDPQRLLRNEEILAALGYEPVGVSGAEDAVAMFRESPGRFDLVLVGQLVPISAALELATTLHGIAPAVPILLATAWADQFAANSLVAAGISDVVPWPIIAAEIASTMTDCLQRKHSKSVRRFGVV